MSKTRWVFVFISFFGDLVSFWNIFKEPDENVFFEMIDRYASLHSIYFGLGGVFSIVLLWALWPKFVWFWNIRARLREKKLERELKFNQAAINALEDLKQLLEAHEFGIGSELDLIGNEEAILALIKALRKFGLKLGIPRRSIDYSLLLKEVISILPHIRLNGLTNFLADEEFKVLY